MPSEKLPEVWLRGPLPGVSALLMPAAHCLMQCRDEIATAADLFHSAEHTHRHTGQLVTTAKLVRSRTT